MTDLRFIDTSGDQHPNGAAIDWNAVKTSGVDGVYVKLSEGGDVDPHGAQDTRDAATAGLHVGVYHFARPDLGNTPQAEASVFNAARKGLPVDCLPCLDSEKDAPNLTVWNSTFLTLVNDQDGSSNGIGYTDRYLRPSFTLPDSRIWIAIPNGTRGDYLGVQYGTTLIPGIPNVVTDVDSFNPSVVITKKTPTEITIMSALTVGWNWAQKQQQHVVYNDNGSLLHKWEDAVNGWSSEKLSDVAQPAGGFEEVNPIDGPALYFTLDSTGAPGGQAHITISTVSARVLHLWQGSTEGVWHWEYLP